MVDLFEDAAEAPDEQQLSINQSYAERYQHNKRRVHLEQLQQKYGEEEGDSDESDSEDVTEDEDGEHVDGHVGGRAAASVERVGGDEPAGAPEPLRGRRVLGRGRVVGQG